MLQGPPDPKGQAQLPEKLRDQWPLSPWRQGFVQKMWWAGWAGSETGLQVPGSQASQPEQQAVTATHQGSCDFECGPWERNQMGRLSVAPGKGTEWADSRLRCRSASLNLAPRWDARHWARTRRVGSHSPEDGGEVRTMEGRGGGWGLQLGGR